jgi:putative MATE family efflux protein
MSLSAPNGQPDLIDSQTRSSLRNARLTTAPVFSTTIKLALPVIAANLLNIAIGMADMIMVGRLGKEALASLVISNSLMMLLFAIGFGMGFATITFVSQHTGAGRTSEASSSAAHSLMFAVILGGIMMIIGNLFMSDLLGFFNAQDRVYRYAMSYTDISFDYMPLYFLLTFGIAIMQGAGDTLTPLLVMVAVNVANIFLNYVFIFGNFGAPRLEVAGAAVGTVSSRGLGALIIFLFLISGKYHITLRLKDFLPRMSEFWGLLRLGVPNSIQSLMRNFNVMILYRILSMTYQPTVAQASLGVGFQAEALAFIPLMGLNTATGAMVGQNLGADRVDRAEQAAWAAVKTGLCLMVLAFLAFTIIPEKIVGLFIHEPEVIESGSWYLRINAIPQLFQTAFVLVGALRGAGDSLRPLIGHITGQWIIRLPLAYFLIKYTGLEEWGVWTAMAASSCIESSIYFWLFRRGYWKSIRIWKR